ncbi:hypothetical protein JAAN108728_08685 [Janibacter anophelis]
MRGYVGLMSTAPPTSVQSRLQAQRVLAFAVISALPVFAVVLVLVLGLEDYPSPVVAGVLFLLNLLAFGVAEMIGYRTPAIAPGAEPSRALDEGLVAMQQTMILRFAITEAPAILALAWAFVEGTAWVYIVSGFWALMSMVWHVWPSRRIATKLERSLDREGGRSGLASAVGG